MPGGWAAGIENLRRRSLLADGPELTLTPAGVKLRADVEAQTNRLAMPAWRRSATTAPRRCGRS
jgi:hypothetical protein